MAQAFSPIQNHILSRLKNARSLRYSDMQPEGVPNDLYNYHLQFLVKKGYVEREDDGYRLSALGVKHVADPVPEPTANQITSLFKMNVITIVSRVLDGELQILNQVRKSNPSYGKVGVMGGVVLKGERTEDAAARKLKSETGLDARFRVVGMERRMLYTDDGLFSDVLFPIVYADSHSGKLVDTDFGENKWVGIDEAIENESAEFDSIEGIRIVLRAIKAGTIGSLPLFYREESKKGRF